MDQWRSKGNLLEWESKSQKCPWSGPGSELSSLDKCICAGKTPLIGGGHLYSWRMLICSYCRERKTAVQFYKTNALRMKKWSNKDVWVVRRTTMWLRWGEGCDCRDESNHRDGIWGKSSETPMGVCFNVLVTRMTFDTGVYWGRQGCCQSLKHCSGDTWRLAAMRTPSLIFWAIRPPIYTWPYLQVCCWFSCWWSANQYWCCRVDIPLE